MIKKKYFASLEMIKAVASRLNFLREEVVFLGGATTGFFITNPAAPEVRSTLDVDVIIKVTKRSEYYRLEDSLRKLGFVQPADEGTPICRWMIDNVLVDIMPSDTKILGFSNRFYAEAIENSIKLELEKDLIINIVTPPYFLATKIEAFYGRGKGDFLASHDIEDVIMLIDGREEIISEVDSQSQELKSFLSTNFMIFMENRSFLDSIPGHLLPDAASQARASLVKSRINAII